MTRNHRALRIVVVVAAGFLLGLWALTHSRQLIDAPDAWIRFVLAGLFAALIVLRPKPQRLVAPVGAGWVVLMGGAGAVLHVGGLLLGNPQAEWIGLLAMVGSGLGWALPGPYAQDALKALFLLYWAHPLPSHIYGALQFTMQQMSVTGSEWLLHMLNVRVWADGLVLKTGATIYEVPAWCSGMRTATVVFLLALGLGIIKRLTPFQKIVAVVAGCVQAVALNAVRIAAMVYVVPQLRAGDDLGFLHDTSGLMVVAAAVLVYVEIAFMRHAKATRDRRAVELTPDLDAILSEHPPFWRRMMAHSGKTGGAVLMLLVALWAGIQLRPTHRAEMYRGVAEGLRDTGKLEDAERLGWIVHDMAPDDTAWEGVMLRMLVMRGHYGEALARLEGWGRKAQGAVNNQIIRAYALMGLNRYAEARQVIDTIHASVRHDDPRVAMILAEMGAYANDLDEVVRHVKTAAQWAPNRSRIRALFPYLRRAHQWEVIDATDPRTVYHDPAQALSAIEAFMNLNKVIDVVTVTEQAVRDWPEDPRLLVPLFYLIGKRPNEAWARRYADHVRRCVSVMRDPDALYELVDHCIHIRRPDLVWLIHARIQALDADYPGLDMMAVRYGQHWFTFHRRFLGWSYDATWESVDLRPYIDIGRLSPIWSGVCDAIPFGDPLSASDTVPVRKAILTRVLQTFDALDRADTLSLRMRYEYALALEMDGRPEAARTVLARIAETTPGEAESVRIALSALYERQGDWQAVYETLRTYAQESEVPHLAVLLRLTTAQMNLRLGWGAIRTARDMVRRYPDAGEAVAALALAVGEYDAPESALSVLSRDIPFRVPGLDMLEAQALRRTQRFVEYRALNRRASLELPSVPTDAQQGYALPAAELALTWHLVCVPSEAQLADHAHRLRLQRSTTTSPFLRDLNTLWLACYEAADPEPLMDPERWLACGRDTTEQAIAMSQLCLLQIRRQRYGAARQVAAIATEIAPDMALMWRFLIGLSGGEPDVVARARTACPEDSEIWLAWLVLRCREGRGHADDAPPQPAWVRTAMAAIEDGAFSAATLTRAAEVLLRSGCRAAAEVAARRATADARSLLPAYIVGLRCALLIDDLEWAQACTLDALHAALRPPPDLYRRLVDIKTRDGALDVDDEMVEALKVLRRNDPDNPLWARMLALVRFRRGGWEVLDSLNQAAAALEAGATDRTTYIVGAEAARLLRNTDRACDLLRQGLERYPDDLVLLNNLAYTLAEAPGRSAEALDLIPRLLKRAVGTPWLIDTVALVYLRNDRLDEAEQALGWIHPEPERGTPAAFRYRLRLAEIAFQRDELQKVVSILRDIVRWGQGIGDEEILNANRLLSKADETLRQLGQNPMSAPAASPRPSSSAR